MEDKIKTLQASQVLDKMNQIERDITINSINDVHHQLVSRWIKLKCWLEFYGE